MGYMNLRVIMMMFICKYCRPAFYQPPKIVYPDLTEDLYYRDSAKVEIHCVAAGNPQPKYTWIKNGSDLQPSVDITYDSNKGVLQIPRFNQRLESVYRCIASNTFGDLASGTNVSCMSPKVRLWLTRLEIFGSPLTNITREVTEFEYFSLPCGDSKTSVADKVTYAWYETRSSKLLNMADRRLYVDGNGTLHFSYVLLRDREVLGYTCGIHMSTGIVQHTQHGTSNILFVKPRDTQNMSTTAPVLQYSNTPVKALRFSSAILECVFSGANATQLVLPTQTWKNDAGNVLRNSSKYKISVDGRQLAIANAQDEDEQMYTCHAINEAGQTTATVLLNVTSEPYFSNGPPKDNTAVEGSDVDFKCDAKSIARESPPSAPVWYINAKKLGEKYDTDKFHLSESDTVLTVMKVRKQKDVMCLQCEVSNDVGTAIANACLEVSLSRKETISSVYIILICIAILFLFLANLFVAYKILNSYKAAHKQDSDTDEATDKATDKADSNTTANVSEHVVEEVETFSVASSEGTAIN